jgi:hypothetical protein
MFGAMTSPRHGLLAALAFAIVMLAPTPATSQNRPRTIVALLAHADDETAVGPALARYAREGVQVHMIIVTDGSGGSGTQTYLQRPDSGPVGSPSRTPAPMRPAARRRRLARESRFFSDFLTESSATIWAIAA